jgi:hypothetical protein
LNRHQKNFRVILLDEPLPRLETQAWVALDRRNLRRQWFALVNISDAALFHRATIQVNADAHRVFATALITGNVNGILRHDCIPFRFSPITMD